MQESDSTDSIINNNPSVERAQEDPPQDKMPTAVEKYKTPENNNTVISAEDYLGIEQNHQDRILSFKCSDECESDNERKYAKDNANTNYELTSDFMNSANEQFVLNVDEKRSYHIDEHISQEEKDLIANNNTMTMQEHFNTSDEYNNTNKDNQECSASPIIDDNMSDIVKQHEDFINSPNSINESDSENRLKIDISDDEITYDNHCFKRRRSSDDNSYKQKYFKTDYDEMRSPTFQENFINSMKISGANNNNDDELYRNDERRSLYLGKGDACSNNNREYDIDEYSWHPHVYAKPPKVPTPHSIVDILGWGIKKTKIHTPSPVRAINTPSPVYSYTSTPGDSRQSPEALNPLCHSVSRNSFDVYNKETSSIKQHTLSQLMNVRKKDAGKFKDKVNFSSYEDNVNIQGRNSYISGRDVQDSISPVGVMSFVTVPSVGGILGGGMVAEQPLDLCVARGRRSPQGISSPPPSMPQDLSKPSKKEPTKTVKRKKSTELPSLKPSPQNNCNSIQSSNINPVLATEDEVSRDSSETEGDGRKKKKARTTFTGRQIFELEKLFEVKKYLSSSERTDMAKLLNVTETQALLREAIAHHISAINDKNTDSNTNSIKKKAWDEVFKSFNAMNRRPRSLPELKAQWKISKMKAKQSESLYKKHCRQTGGGPRPQSPSGEDKEIISLIPSEFEQETNRFDDDGELDVEIFETVMTPTPTETSMRLPKTSTSESSTSEVAAVPNSPEVTFERQERRITFKDIGVKIWFQNRRTKWKKQDNISNAEAAEHKTTHKGDDKESGKPVRRPSEASTPESLIVDMSTKKPEKVILHTPKSQRIPLPPTNKQTTSKPPVLDLKTKPNLNNHSLPTKPGYSVEQNVEKPKDQHLAMNLPKFNPADQNLAKTTIREHPLPVLENDIESRISVTKISNTLPILNVPMQASSISPVEHRIAVKVNVDSQKTEFSTNEEEQAPPRVVAAHNY